MLKAYGDTLLDLYAMKLAVQKMMQNPPPPSTPPPYPSYYDPPIDTDGGDIGLAGPPPTSSIA
jgi:hypothetical protein